MIRLLTALVVMGSILNGCKNEVAVITAQDLPQAITSNAIVTDSTVILTGEVTFTGGDNTTSRGICWSESPNPTTNDQFYQDNTRGLGAFSIDVFAELKPNTTYYARAFVENSVGKIYVNEISFNTGYFNPKGAFINSRGCLECEKYRVGDRFELGGTEYIVADRDMLDNAIANGIDITKYCTSKVTDMQNMFSSNKGFNQEISNWDVSKVNFMNGMFYEASAFNQNIGNWDVSSVTNMSYMFTSVRSFNQDISDWDVSKVTNMAWMFGDANAFSQNIGNWDVSKVTNMQYMFSYAISFNQNISRWDVSLVTDMDGMFNYTPTFKQDLTQWCVSNIDREPYSFSSESGLSSANHPVWGTCP